MACTSRTVAHTRVMALTFGIMLLIPVTALGQVVVSGTVLDEQNQPLTGVFVRAHEIVSGTVVAAESNDQGAYRLDLTPGQYRIIASQRGRADSAVSIDVKDGTNIVRDFLLLPGVFTETVTVTAARGERAAAVLPVMVTTVTSAEIEDRGPETVQEAIEEAPSIQYEAVEPGLQRPRLRGLEANRVLIMVDGEALNNSRVGGSGFGVSPNMIDLSQVESVEVVGGPSSALYGSDGMAGSINIITREPFRPITGTAVSGSLAASYNSTSRHNTQSVTAEVAETNWALRANYARFDYTGWEVGDDRITPEMQAPYAELRQEAAELYGSPAFGIPAFSFYELFSGDRVPQGEGDGQNVDLGLWLHPGERHTLKARFLGSWHENLDETFRGPPVGPRLKSYPERDLTRLSLGWEAVDLTGWLPRVWANVYHQRWSQQTSQTDFVIDEGSSYVENCLEYHPDAPWICIRSEYEITGDPSTYTMEEYSEESTEVETTGISVAAYFEPWNGAILTVGANYQTEDGAAKVAITQVDADGNPVGETDEGLFVPDTTYENLGTYAQLEWRAAPWVRLIGGLRYDRYESLGRPTENWPTPNAREVILYYLPMIEADPQGLDPDGLEGIENLGTGNIYADSSRVTKNIGVTFFIPGGINPFIRWADSFRESDAASRFGTRTITAGQLGFGFIPNVALGPELGEGLDIGLKIDRVRWQAQLGYFRNKMEDFHASGVGIYTDPTAPAGIPPMAQFIQRVNGEGAEFEGFEISASGNVSLGRAGGLSPWVSMNWLTGKDDAVTAQDAAIMDGLYNRDDTVIRLSGSADDMPFSNQLPFQANFGLRYTPPNGKWFLAYDYRHAASTERVDPFYVLLLEYTYAKSLEGYDRHSIRGGYRFSGSDRWGLSLTGGVDNILDEFYVVPFSRAPAPGRTFHVGMRIRFDRLSD